jgi:error-prone DNA polymerase
MAGGGVTDRNSLARIVRAHEAAKVTGVRLIVGCRLDLEDFPSLLVYPTDRKAYARLCRLLTIGKERAGKGKCELFWKGRYCPPGVDFLIRTRAGRKWR